MQPARSWHFVFARRVGLEVPLVRRHSLLSLQARQLPLGVRLPFVITSGAPPPLLRNQRDSGYSISPAGRPRPELRQIQNRIFLGDFRRGRMRQRGLPPVHPPKYNRRIEHACTCTHTCPQLNRGVYNCQGLAPISLSQEKSSFGALPPSLT